MSKENKMLPKTQIFLELILKDKFLTKKMKMGKESIERNLKEVLSVGQKKKPCSMTNLLKCM